VALAVALCCRGRGGGQGGEQPCRGAVERGNGCKNEVCGGGRRRRGEEGRREGRSMQALMFRKGGRSCAWGDSAAWGDDAEEDARGAMAMVVESGLQGQVAEFE
jgi:hypothetical protein